jgi:mannose-1-phosphate guanylyltransferase
MQVSPDQASEFGELVADQETSELLHYAEKPETFVRCCVLPVAMASFLPCTLLIHSVFQVSELINCGVYIFSPEIFSLVKEVATSRTESGKLSPPSNLDTHCFLLGIPIVSFMSSFEFCV